MVVVANCEIYPLPAPDAISTLPCLLASLGPGVEAPTLLHLADVLLKRIRSPWISEFHKLIVVTSRIVFLLPAAQGQLAPSGQADLFQA